MGVMRTYLKGLLASLLIAASGVSTAVATDYYITQAGSGTNGGLTYANSDSVATFNAGASPYDNLDDDTVYLCDTITTAVVVPDSGAVGHIITIRGDYTGHAGVISGACTNPGDNCAGLQLYTAAGTVGRTYITVDGVTVTNSNAMGIATKYTGSNITIKNCTVTGAKDGGIVATTALIDETKTMTDITIENNTVTGCNANYPTTNVHEAITVENVDTFTVRNNTSYSNYKEGLDLKNDAENGTVYGNHIYSNGTNCATCPNVYFDGSHDINFYQNSIHDCTTAQGILLGSETSDGANNNFDCNNINIYYNLIYNNASYAMKIWTGASADADQYVDDIDIYNNVFYDTDCIYIDSSTHVGTTANNLKNNIFWTGSSLAVQDESTLNIFVDNCGYNLFSTSVGTNECTGTGDVSTGTSPFVNAGTDFHLTSTSGAKDVGTNVSLTSDFSGRTVPYNTVQDIGAFEYPALYWVRPASGEYMTEDGLQYNSAYDGFADIVWADVDLGNGTLYVAGTHREQLAVGESGESGVPITIQSYDTDPAILLGSTDKDSPWTNTAGHIYEISGYAGDVGNIYYNTNTSVTSGTKHTEAECSDTATNLTADGDFCWEATAEKVYVHSGTGEPSVVWDGIEVPIVTGSLSDDCAVKIPARDYVTIDGLTVKYFNGTGIRAWYTGGAGCDYVTVQNCNISYGGGKYQDGDYELCATTPVCQFGNGIDLLGSGTNITFQNNTITQVFDYGIVTETGNSGYTISNHTVTGNTISYCGRGYGFSPTNATASITGVVVSNNHISYSGYGWSDGGSSGVADREGMSIKGFTTGGTYSCSVTGNYIHNCEDNGIVVKKSNLTATIQNNAIYSNASRGIMFAADPAAGTPTANVYYNLIYENGLEEVRLSNAATLTMYNNVLYDTVSPSNSNFYVADTYTPTFKNNIFYSTDDPCFYIVDATPVYTADNNIYWRAGDGVIINLNGTTYLPSTFVANYKTAVTPQDANSYAADPLFHTAGSNFHLTSTSPAISGGATNLGLTTDFDGVAVPQGGYDIGAFEYINWALRGATLNGALLP